MKKSMFQQEKDNLYSYVIRNSDNSINLKIYLTKQQIDSINQNGKSWRLAYRRLERNIKSTSTKIYDDSSILVYPTIEYRPKRKRLHLGNFLYPNMKISWDKSIWKSIPWDLSPENLNISWDKTAMFCGYCKNLTAKINQETINCCKDCHYLREIFRFAESRAVHITKFDLDLSKFINQKNCSLTKLPLNFRSMDSLTGATLDRINSNLGYINKNTRLLCRGLNQLKRDYDDKYLFEFISNSNSNKNEVINFNFSEIYKNKIKEKLNLISNSLRFSKESDLTFEFLLDKLKETKGICIITGVPLDLKYSKPYSLYIPSLDRIDSFKGYTKILFLMGQIEWKVSMLQSKRLKNSIKK